MKSYLPLKRAASIVNREADDLVLLCQANKLDCRKTNDDWFVSERDVVDTLSITHPAVLDAELKDLRKNREYYAHLASTENTGKKLIRSVTIVLVILFGSMAILAWTVNLAQTGSFAQSLDTLNNNLAAISQIWK